MQTLTISVVDATSSQNLRVPTLCESPIANHRYQRAPKAACPGPPPPTRIPDGSFRMDHQCQYTPAAMGPGASHAHPQLGARQGGERARALRSVRRQPRRPRAGVGDVQRAAPPGGIRTPPAAAAAALPGSTVTVTADVTGSRQRCTLQPFHTSFRHSKVSACHARLRHGRGCNTGMQTTGCEQNQPFKLQQPLKGAWARGRIQWWFWPQPRVDLTVSHTRAGHNLLGGLGRSPAAALEADQLPQVPQPPGAIARPVVLQQQVLRPATPALERPRALHRRLSHYTGLHRAAHKKICCLYSRLQIRQ